MAVVIETTLGDITVDLYLDQRPVTCLNFLKLCKMKYYNFNLFHSIRSGFIAQTGDPTGEGSGGQSIWGILDGPEKRFFSGEKMPKIRHTDAGLISMVCTGDMMVGSQFFITLAPDLDSLDGTHCVIGEVTEGHEVLTKLNEVICDETHRPYRDVRITHTVVLEDPFNDPPGLRAPSRSPSPNPERLRGGRIAPDEEIDETQGKSAEEVQEMIEEKEAKARATILEIVGDLPDAEIAPPENVLFVCKLNPVTTDEDLEIIFSRFGKIVSCEVIRDKKTGNSLQYAFIEFDNKKACEDAYFKMDNVLIDDRRIHVDFSQSVSKMRWLGKGRGVQYFDEENNKNTNEIHDHKERKRDERDRKNERYENNRKRSRDNYSNGKRHHDNDRNDRDQQHKRKRDGVYDTNHKDRSRSRSRLNSSHDYEKYKRHKDCNTSSKSHRYIDKEHQKKNNSSSHKSKQSHKSKSPDRKIDNTSDYKRSSDGKRTDRDSNNHNRGERNDSRSRYSKHEENRYKETSRERKDNKYKQDIEPKTPSPVILSKKVKNSSNKRNDKVVNKKKVNRSNMKKKRKESTSSSSSSESSSSTDSSSSESYHKKRKLRRKRNDSTSSSSSSSTSSSSSSSSSESSSESTSSSDSGNKKNIKSKSKKAVKKPKKKL